jgi:hypothetical protein
VQTSTKIVAVKNKVAIERTEKFLKIKSQTSQNLTHKQNAIFCVVLRQRNKSLASN